ncbi:TetR/AcrR family transcriptional regulator [Streptomyces lichenis]|uniref:TetR/AcrR family transcriptional regulator n=1 Tax=Streptomyces lichenis TaxID=2306967 RepID=A0ABT0IBR4_9ACTN|nr:TetR/AcrR family transcriptional regulator [Streptomyces lichenis]MCK8678761.1 TetR/AcrR family transcriptional regulator [Streptomyces lichenis]
MSGYPVQGGGGRGRQPAPEPSGAAVRGGEAAADHGGPRPGDRPAASRPAADDTPETPARRPKRRKRSAAGTRSALMAAAAQRFGAYGYEGTNLRDIARDAGVDAALVYRYFGSKDALFAAVSCPSALFDPLLETPLDEVAGWLCDFLAGGPPAEEIPHPVVAVLSSPDRQTAVREFRDNLAEVFSERFAARLDGPDAPLRAELVAALLLGTSLLGRAIGTPALARASEDDALHRQLGKAIGALLRPEPDAL